MFGVANVNARDQLPSTYLKELDEKLRDAFTMTRSNLHMAQCHIIREFSTLDDDGKMHSYAKTILSAKAKRQGAVLSRKKNSIGYCLPCIGETICAWVIFLPNHNGH